uniref:VWFC domain-containing protein n=1 Tax=Phlebotomus papatasi TaxID=29031 RepID=A0A1B0DDP2_PHLPP
MSESGNVIVSAEKEICEDQCKLGFKYLSPTLGSDKCCGECIQSHCKVENELKELGASWKSPDNCTTFRCEMKDDQFYIVAEQESCPNIDDCPKDRRYTKGCCVFCQPEISEQIPEELEPLQECPETPLPKCGENQVKKIEYDSNNCTKIICECKPASDCPPLEVFPSELLPGFKVIKDTSGCCPVARL